MKTLRYGRVFNLGNYESERLEVEEQFPDDADDKQAFLVLRQRLGEAHDALQERRKAERV